jgi:ACS family glucarate transporter-like MFS transporter
MSGRYRWVIIFLTFIIAAVSYLDRNNISIAASSIQKEFLLSNVQLGVLFSSFAFGYALMQPLAGYIADRFGAHRAIGVAMIWWSAFTVLTALAPAGWAWSFGLLLAIRVMLGLGEAVIFPASNRLVAAWIPSKERGFANGMIFAGVGLGGAVAPLLITSIMLVLDWRWAFHTCAAIGVVLTIVWFAVGRNSPRGHPRVTDEELAYIEAGLPINSRETGFRWSEIILDRQVMTLTASYFCFGYVAWIFFTWFFKYLSDVRGLELKASAVYATLPFIAMALTSSFGGLFSDWLAQRYGKRIGRCGVAFAGLTIASGLVWMGTQVEDARNAAMILAGGAGALYLAQSAFWAVSADIGRQSAGSLSGVMNMGAQTGGIVTASLTPFIADAYGWTASFTVAALIALVGAVLWLFIDPAHVLGNADDGVNAAPQAS